MKPGTALMPKLKAMVAAAACMIGGPLLAQPAPAGVDYGNEASWLCLPGRSDPCSQPLATTALNSNGYGSVGQSRAEADAPVDCFYIYPTVSRDPGQNSDLVPGVEEQGAAMVQFARFGTVCRTFAPMYRQLTVPALMAALGGADVTGGFALAYADVLAAWRDYLEHRNQGRPFVLIGHSQGTILLSRLLAEEIEGKKVAAQMLSALLIGYNVEVPEGQVVGGTFASTPLCTRVGETGCVITYVSFRATNPPPAGSLFGRATKPGMTVGCTNPARLRRETTPLDSYWFTPGSVVTDWSSSGAPPTPFVRTEGLVSAACVHRGPVGYLSVVVNADADDARTDRIPGDVVVAGTTYPGWGIHPADINLAQGDLIALVVEQVRAFGKSR